MYFPTNRVQAMTRTAPVYTVRWTSQIVRSNNRLGPPTPAPNAVSSARIVWNSRQISNKRSHSDRLNSNYSKFSDFYVIINNNCTRLIAVALLIFLSSSGRFSDTLTV